MLIDRRDPMLLSNQRVGHDDFFTVQDDLSAIRLVDARKRLDKGAFPRAIFSDDGMNLTLFQVKTHIIQSFDAGKNFGDVVHLQQIFRHLHPSPNQRLLHSIASLLRYRYYIEWKPLLSTTQYLLFNLYNYLSFVLCILHKTENL